MKKQYLVTHPAVVVSWLIFALGGHLTEGFCVLLKTSVKNNCSPLVLFSSSSSSPDGIENDSSQENCKEQAETTPKKKKSRLAQMAEDWMEEEDELDLYWQKFQDTKQSGASTQVEETDLVRGRSSDQILSDYYESKDIDMKVEREYKTQIEAAIELANKGDNPRAGAKALESLFPYLQTNSILGGKALLALVKATLAATNRPDYDRVEDILTSLQRHPQMDIQRQARRDLRNARSDRQIQQNEDKGIWKNLFESW